MATYEMESAAEAICVALGYAFHGGIGAGTFKETFLTKKADGTSIALKVLRPGCSSERSAREVEAMKRCSHPNIVTLLDLAQLEHQGTTFVYLLESYMAGGTLEDRLTKALLDREETFALGDQLIRAVAHIADNDLVHRDFKPANIMYPAIDAEAMVGDFGIVRDLTKSSITKTYFVSGPGTPFFAAPEQLNNEKTLIDWRTDQFAIGVTLAIAHFGTHPYRADGDSDDTAISRVASRDGPSERFLKLVTSSKLPVLARMVAPWPAERLRSPAGLLEEWRGQRRLK